MSFSVLSLVGFVSMTSMVDVAPREGLSISEALSEGQAEFSTRLRYEDVSQYGDRGAQALTYRVKAAYETEPFYYLKAKLEATHVGALPDDEGYNSLENDQNDDLVIADPEQTFLSQYWLSYEVANTVLRYGRQKLSFDNERLLGVQDVRQAESSVSGVSLSNESFNFLRLRAGKLYRFESPLDDEVAGGQQSIDGSYFNAEYRGFINSLLSLYVLDLENESGNELWDSRTWGVRFSGDVKNEPRLEYTFEYAHQTGEHDNPGDYSESYYHLGIAGTYAGIRIGTGREVLGAGEDGFFVTPLADLNRFQGWNDQFENGGLGNISGGIQDTYTSLGYVWSDESALAGLELHLHYHQFESDDDRLGAGDLGKEYNVELNYQSPAKIWNMDLGVSLRFSDYQEQSFGQDTQKSWVDVTAQF